MRWMWLILSACHHFLLQLRCPRGLLWRSWACLCWACCRGVLSPRLHRWGRGPGHWVPGPSRLGHCWWAISYKRNVYVSMPAYMIALFLLFPNYINLTTVRRSFNDNGPMALLDQVKDVAQAVLEDKNILTKYD